MVEILSTVLIIVITIFAGIYFNTFNLSWISPLLLSVFWLLHYLWDRYKNKSNKNLHLLLAGVFLVVAIIVFFF